MIELIALFIVLGTFHETAKRRGVKSWPFIVAGFLGWLLVGMLGAALVGVGPHMLLAWGWIGLTYGSIFVIGGEGRMMKESWQCPECRFYNSPSTLVCPCGYRPAQAQEPSE